MKSDTCSCSGDEAKTTVAVTLQHLAAANGASQPIRRDPDEEDYISRMCSGQLSAICFPSSQEFGECLCTF